MRKLLMTLMLALLMVLTACGNEAAKSETPAAEAEPAKAPTTTTLVAYFSCSGHTKALAENAAQVLNADLFEIKPAQPYTAEDLDWHNEQSRSTLEMNDDSARPAIDGTVANFEQYKTVVIAYPIWWHQAPRIIDTFVEQYDWNGKTVIPICTSGGSDIGTSGSYIANLAKVGNWKNGKCFFANTSLDEVKAWASDL